MVSFSKILVGVDLSHADRVVCETLSDHCRQAVEKAIQLAKGFNGELCFVTSLDLSEQALHLLEIDGGPNTSKVEKEACEVLQKLVDEATAAGVTARYELALGSPSERIIQEVTKNNHSLVVIGRKSHSSLSDFFNGRTAVQLLRKCPVPVYVAKADPVREIESILIADDFTGTGEKVLDAGVQMARMLDCYLHVVHVIEGDEEEKLAASGVPVEKLQELNASTKSTLQSVQAERLSRTDYRTLTHGTKTHLVTGKAEKSIIDLIKEHNVDQLVMGTIGRTGLSAMFVGNTAERLMGNADCSLLVIKPDDFKCPVSV